MALEILLVEDSPTQAEFYKSVLMEMGLQVRLAHDGKTAIDMAVLYAPNLIILDVNLPGGLDGLQVCYRLSRMPETHQIPVIMLTQRDSSKDAIEGMKVGAVDYIAKDEFAVQTLLESMKQLGIVG